MNQILVDEIYNCFNDLIYSSIQKVAHHHHNSVYHAIIILFVFLFFFKNTIYHTKKV